LITTFPEVVAVGTLALDTVETPSAREVDVPGGSALYFAAAARFFAPVSVVGVAGEDYPMEVLTRMESEGVDASGVRVVPGESFRWHVRYGASLGSRKTLATNRGVAVREAPVLADHHRNSRFLFLGSTHPRIQRAVLDQAGSPRHVIVDTMTHWIHDERDELEDVLVRADIVLVNEEEAMALGGTGDAVGAALGLAGRLEDERGSGEVVVVVKRGRHGALAVRRGAVHAVRAVADVVAVDPTGAGDAFAGGFVGALARHGWDVGNAMAHGSATASFALESFSVEALQRATAVRVGERAGRVGG